MVGPKLYRIDGDAGAVHGQESEWGSIIDIAISFSQRYRNIILKRRCEITYDTIRYLQPNIMMGAIIYVFCA